MYQNTVMAAGICGVTDVKLFTHNCPPRLKRVFFKKPAVTHERGH